MKRERLGGITILAAILCLHHFLAAQESTTVKIDSTVEKHGITSTNASRVPSAPPLPPMGDVSYADQVVLYDPGALGTGTGDEPALKYQNASEACGPLAWPQDAETGFVSLGLQGTLILKFKDNLLLDGPGPDLCIYQGNGKSDTMTVWISQDGIFYFPVGTFSEHHQLIDIHSVAKTDMQYPYVKIRDNSTTGQEQSLGLDIDAVAAFNTAKIMIFPASRFFKGQSSSFLETATPLLDSLASAIQAFNDVETRIEVYSNPQGAEDYNLLLTQQQAGAIRNFLIDHYHMPYGAFNVYGWGAENPLTETQINSPVKGARVEFYIFKKSLQQ